MAKKFRDAIDGANAALSTLPLVHTTSSPTFEYFLAPPPGESSQTLMANGCPVYNEPLLYCFYAKPSFRPRDSDTLHVAQMKQFAPVCLVIEPPSTIKPKRIMPFDSGAYDKGLVTNEGHAHYSLPKELFELQDPHAPRSIVSLFYGSNAAYYDECPILPSPIDPRTNTCVETYVSLISRTGSNHGDSRLNSIEVQFSEHIELNKPGTVRAVAMAEDLYDQREQVRNALSAWGAEPLLYPLSARYNPSACCQHIDRLVRNFLNNSRLLS
ncbi:hypothetical protein [Tardiphaga sp. 803_E3_N1_3]|uniref:hypothetical protein n=1 Tax=Tardiphaga sp. 803_E3_N1_3 TaxID=3240785 RepID=UPI003F2351CE